MTTYFPDLCQWLGSTRKFIDYSFDKTTALSTCLLHHYHKHCKPVFFLIPQKDTVNLLGWFAYAINLAIIGQMPLWHWAHLCHPPPHLKLVRHNFLLNLLPPSRYEIFSLIGKKITSVNTLWGRIQSFAFAVKNERSTSQPVMILFSTLSWEKKK